MADHKIITANVDSEVTGLSDRKAGNIGENNATKITFTFSTKWSDLTKKIVWLSAAGVPQVAVTLVDDSAMVFGDILDAVGTCSFTLYGYNAADEVDMYTSATQMSVGRALSALGGVAPSEYTNIIAECDEATIAANAAAETALDAASSCAELEGDVQAAEAERVAAEAERVAAELVREGNEEARIENADVFVARHPNARKAIITFVDDDGKAEVISKLKSTFDAHGVKPTIAINPNLIGTASYMTWGDVETLTAEGYEIINHGYNHAEPLALTLDQIQANYILEKSIFEAHGLTEYDYYVYPGYTPPPAVPNQVSNADLKNRLRKVYKCCLNNASSPENYMPFETMEIKRVGGYGGSATKAYINFCIENNCWCVLFGHAWMAECSAAALDSILTYIDGKVSSGLLEYKTVKEMVDNYQTVIELGNGTAGADYFRVDKNGIAGLSVNGRDINDIKSGLESVESKIITRQTEFVDVDITEYPSNSITVEPIFSARALNMGLPDLGTITTVRNYTAAYADAASYQEYHRSGGVDVWERRWLVSLARWNFWFPRTVISRPSSGRPRYAPHGLIIHDLTLNKIIMSSTAWCFYTANTVLSRSTAYKKWDIINPTGADMFVCLVAGTTSATAPQFDVSGANKLTVDGSVTWSYLQNLKATWKDMAGTTV